jgi:hypothetical protein
MLVACSGDGGSGAEFHSFETIVEDGIPVAVNDGPPKYEEELFEYELVLTLREDEREESLIYTARGFALGDDGRYYVADSGSHRVAVFDSDGRFQHAFGRDGQGPGEFRTVGVPVVADGTVTILDMIGQRVSRFRTDGTLIDTFKLPGGQILAPVSDCWYRPDDVKLFESLDIPVFPVVGEEAGVRVSALDADGDTMWTHRTDDVTIMKMIEINIMGNATPIPTPIPFGPVPDVDFLPDFGIVVSNGLGPDLYYMDEGGAITRRVRLTIPPEPPTEEDMAEAHAGIQREMEAAEDDMMRSLHESRAEQLFFPEAKAPWAAIHLDDSGFVWLQLPDLRGFTTGDMSDIYRVVSPAGEYLGLTTVPSGTFHRVERGRFLLIRTDPETDAQEILVFAIRPRVAGLQYP